MLRASCLILIKKLFQAGKINEETKEKCLKWIQSDDNHRKIRNLIAMILLPKKLHLDDESQAAYLRAAVSRVSQKKQNFKSTNKISFSDCKPNCVGKARRFDVVARLSTTLWRQRKTQVET